MLADAEILNSRLSKIEGSGDLGTHIVNVVKNKTVIVSPDTGDPSSVALDTTPNPHLPSKTTTDTASESQNPTVAVVSEKPS